MVHLSRHDHALAGICISMTFDDVALMQITALEHDDPLAGSSRVLGAWFSGLCACKC